MQIDALFFQRERQARREQPDRVRPAPFFAERRRLVGEHRRQIGPGKRDFETETRVLRDIDRYVRLAHGGSATRRRKGKETSAHANRSTGVT
ncbi:hypothetical protein [Burkholderia anthina]|nr:hypothetical protein [Burkholderia anthina]